MILRIIFDFTVRSFDRTNIEDKRYVSYSNIE